MFRKFQLLLLGAILVVAAFSTGWAFLFYLVYLGVLVVGGSYVLTRFGLADLEAGYAVNQLSGHVGDRIRVTYTLRNTSRIPKPWLEIQSALAAMTESLPCLFDPRLRASSNGRYAEIYRSTYGLRAIGSNASIGSPVLVSSALKRSR